MIRMDDYLDGPTIHIGSGIGKKMAAMHGTSMIASDQADGTTEARTSKASNEPYPLSPGELRKLSAQPLSANPITIRGSLCSGGKTTVYVGQRPDLELVLQVPTGLLTYFIPRESLQVSDAIDSRPQVLVLQYCSRAAVGWFINWMLRGGKPLKHFAEQSKEGHAVEVLLHRLHVVTVLNIPGNLREQLASCLEQAFQETSAISPKLVHWLYTHTSPKVAPSLRPLFAAHTLDAVLYHNLLLHGTCPYEYANSHALLRADLTKGLKARQVAKRLHEIQKYYPLEVARIRFIYNFTGPGASLRKVVARDLFALIDTGKVADPEAYRIFAIEQHDFDKDMLQAKGDRASRVGNFRDVVGNTGEEVVLTLDEFVARLRKDIDAGILAPPSTNSGKGSSSVDFLDDGTVIASSDSSSSLASLRISTSTSARGLSERTNSTGGSSLNGTTGKSERVGESRKNKSKLTVADGEDEGPVEVESP